VAAVWLVVIASAVWGLARFQIDPDVAALFPKDDPTLRLTRHLQGDSPPARSLLVVLRAADPRMLEDTLPALAEALRQSPYLEKVNATREEFAGARAAWFRRAPLAGLPDASVERLKARLGGPERRAALESSVRGLGEDALAGKTLALQDPLGLRWIFDEAGESMAARFPARLRDGSPYLIFENPPLALLSAVGKEDSTRADFSQALLADVNRGIARILPAGVTAELAGGYVSATAHSRAMRRDMIFQTIVSSALVLFFLSWFTRSLPAPFLLLVPVALSIGCGLAFGGWILGPLTPLVVSVAAILVAQPIDFSLHFFSRWREERRDRPAEEAVIRSQSSLERPFVGAATATMAAFLALLTSRFPGFVHLGFLLFLGMAVLLAASMSLFPVLLLKIGPKLRGGRETLPWGVRAAVRAAGGRGGRVAAGAILLVGIGAWVAVGVGKIRIDLDVRNMMAPGDPGQQVLERLEKDLGVTLSPVFALLEKDVPPEDLHRRVAALRARGVVGFADGAHELFLTPERQARNARFLKETAGWVDATLTDLAGLGVKSEPFREGLEATRRLLEAPPPSPDRLDEPEFRLLRDRFFYEQARVVHLFAPRSLWNPAERAAFDAAARSELVAEARFYSAFHLPDHYSSLLSRDLAKVAGVAAVAVAVISIISLGSIGDGLRALAPVFVATGVTLVSCVFLGGTLNLMNMVAIPIVLATGVDGGIHYVARFRELGRGDPVQALRDTGPGVWGSSITTLLGFGAIGGSETPGLSSMGVLVMVGAGVTILATFFLLPALMRRP